MIIANVPTSPRDHSRLMVVDKHSGTITHSRFDHLLDYLTKDDVLVFNQTKVFPARLFGKKESGGQVEILLLKKLESGLWQTISKPGLKLNQKIILTEKIWATAVSLNSDQTLNLKFSSHTRTVLEGELFSLGQTPLPPYIHSPHSEKEIKKEYQTVYAKTAGSAAAPTAGLHFTNRLLNKLKEKGIQTEFVTLHVGLGTFKPVKVENLKTKTLHIEDFIIDSATAQRLNQAKKEGKRIIAVGTTTTRVLETCAKNNQLIPHSATTNIFILPPYKFKFVDALITNFHLPSSSLMYLVSAFVKKPSIIQNAYQTAEKMDYRFYSFGDAMLLI